MRRFLLLPVIAAGLALPATTSAADAAAPKQVTLAGVAFNGKANLKLSLKQSLAKNELHREEEIKRLKEVERKEMQKLREQFERNYQELLANYETRLSNLKDDLELRKNN